MTNIYFEVAIEGIAYQYSNFNQARDKYIELKECGFHEAVLRKVVNGEKLRWNEKSCVFLA